MQKVKIGIFAVLVALCSGCSSSQCCSNGGWGPPDMPSPTFITASNGGKYFPYGDTSDQEGEAYYFDRSTYYRRGMTYYSDGNAYRD